MTDLGMGELRYLGTSISPSKLRGESDNGKSGVFFGSRNHRRHGCLCGEIRNANNLAQHRNFTVSV